METASDSYFSIEGPSKAVFRDKASKFLAFAMPVSSEDEVKSALESLRKSYHDANHHCYAYRLGAENQAYRVNDDGEPAGSAGKPIYGQILSMGLSDVLVVVVRYFGGTKLGIPGLIHAYRTTAREALEQAMITEKVIRVHYSVGFEYPLMNEIMRILKDEGVKIVKQTATERCEIEFQVRRNSTDIVEKRISRLRNVTLTMK